MYCYLGYYGVCYLGDEVKAPARTIPRAIIISILGVLAINFLVSLSIIGVVPWREVMSSPFVASVVMQRIYGGRAGVAMTLLIVWTAFASVYALILTYSRVPFAAAEDGNFFRLFSKLHPSKDFPHYSLLLIGGLSALAGFFDLADVITALLTARILVQFCGQIAALEFLRRFRHDIARPFRMWLYPLPSAIAFFGWMAIFLNSGARYIAYGMATMLLGVIAYFVMARRGRLWPFQSGNAVLKILVGLSTLSLAACSTQPATTPPAITFQSIPDGEIWFRNSQIQLRFDSEMYCRVYLYQNDSLHSINDIPPDPAKARPPHFITVNGEELRDFQVDYKNVGASEIRTQFGAGRKLNLTGYAKTSQGVIIEKKLAVELYEDFPDAALVSVTYRNTDKTASIVVTRSPSSFFRMDAARGNAGTPSYEFWIAFGDSEDPPAARIDLNYSRTFRSPEDGRVPLVDLWTSRMGMAVGNLSSTSRELVATVAVTPDQKVEVEFPGSGSVQLAPNAVLSIPKAVWLVHAGEARVARERYRELRRKLDGGGA